MGVVLGFLVVIFLLGLLLLFKNPFLRVLFAVLVCAGCALEAGTIGISYSGATIWEGGIPNVPFWAAVMMTVFGGLLAYFGFVNIVRTEGW